MAASLQLSMLAFRQILEFDPVTCNFNISAVSTKLTHLFVLATTNQRQLGELEHIQHVLTAYARIKQPEQWASWVRLQIDRFEESLLTTCQSFMNSAAIKYVKIASPNSGFGGSSTTLQEDIVVMVSAVSSKRKAPTLPRSKTSGKTSNGDKKSTMEKSPPFVCHYKSAPGPEGTTYKVGDTKTWEGQTYYYCRCPCVQNPREGYIQRLRSPLLFSVLLSGAFISSSSSHALLSAVDVPIQRCHPAVQQSHKSFRRSRRRKHGHFFSWYRFLGLLLLSQKTSAAFYSLPGTNH